MVNFGIASTAKDSLLGIKEALFVASEQVLDTSGRASIQHAATKVTNSASFIPSGRLPCLWQTRIQLMCRMAAYQSDKNQQRRCR